MRVPLSRTSSAARGHLSVATLAGAAVVGLLVDPILATGGADGLSRAHYLVVDHDVSGAGGAHIYTPVVCGRDCLWAATKTFACNYLFFHFSSFRRAIEPSSPESIPVTYLILHTLCRIK